ncbi:hypothetical protein [Pedosphaera parvula]|uniref:Uncharacterized protein n=1 Tax=Pedosphaera parvula (strain Ellin514) TaxID=320771 RepID=B9XBQ4_PEDPL|nr:hypothetical protein [Pedosphaera parvula]EEF62939.1 hypothetical protein Cflav_PD5574 [Pedosphaera parvula Ellin514]
MDISEINYGMLNLLRTFEGAHPMLFRFLIGACIVTFFMALTTDRLKAGKGSGNSSSEPKGTLVSDQPFLLDEAVSNQD